VSTVTKQIVFAISDTGGGHRSGAAAIIAAMENQDNIKCTIIDLLRATDFPILRQAPKIYDYCSRNHLWLNNLFFRNTNSINRINTLTKMVFFRSRRRIESELAHTSPDAVVAVHPLVIGLLKLARRSSGATWPIITVVTDLVTIHASWATPGADLYLVPTREAMRSLLKHGIPASKIIYTGFPVHPKFIDNKLSQQQARASLGLEADRFTVLLTGGGVGAGNMAEWVTALKEECGDKQILVVTGNNKQLLSELQQQNTPPGRVKVYGFVSNMNVLMAASSVVVSKAGPGTIMEGVTMRRPLIITEAVGIQETGNIDYVLKNNLGYYCPTPAQACKAINEIGLKTFDDTVYSSTAIAANGSGNIAGTILEHLSGTARRLQQQSAGSSEVFLGA